MSTTNSIHFEYNPDMAIGSNVINSIGSFVLTNATNIGFAYIIIAIIFSALISLRQKDKTAFFFKSLSGFLIAGIILAIVVSPPLQKFLSSIFGEFGRVFSIFKF